MYNLPKDAQILAPGLYVVATPIGNLEDLTHRAARILMSAQLILCEDTRVTAKLLSTYAIKTKCLPYNDHTTAEIRSKVLGMIEQGAGIALVSDAGTPLISDPGYKLVRTIRDAGGTVFTVPGPSALTAALSIAGAPTDKFTFGGFLPAKAKARKDSLRAYGVTPGTLVFYETAKRLIPSLEEGRTILGERIISIGRELTKRYEEVREGTFSELISHYSTHPPKGEIVLIIHPASAKIWEEAEIDAALLELLQTQSVKDAASKVAHRSDQPRQRLYRRALELKRK